jgi:hypothetical protein
MANVVTKKLAYIDTFGADVVLAVDYVRVLSITTACIGGAETAFFKNEHGQVVFITGGLTSLVDHYCPSQPVQVEGLVFDDTLSSLEAGDFIIVHFA